MHRHIVTQIVKTELVVSTKRDVCLICLATLLRVWSVLVYAVNRQSVEHIKRTHPFRVTLGKVVIHRYHMYAVTCQGIEEHRACSHQCLTLTCRHLGNLTLMQHRATEELYVIMYHLPLQVIATSCPMVVVYSLVTVYSNKVILRVSRQLTVKIRSSNNCLLILSKTSCCILHDRECYRINLIQCLLQSLKRLFL